MIQQKSEQESEGGATVSRFVLLEEEATVRAVWKRIAERKGLDLLVYDCPSVFLTDLRSGRLNESCRYYLDQDFGGIRAVGTRVAELIRDRFPKAYIALATAYPSILFKDEISKGLLNDVFGKYPYPFNDPRERACAIEREWGKWNWQGMWP